MQTGLDDLVSASESSREAAPLRAWPTRAPLPLGKVGALYQYLPALDGLRALSIFWVLSVHWPTRLALRNTAFALRGSFGVEIFFAISGFLVTRSLHQCVVRSARNQTGKSAIFWDFIVRRVARIWPPFFLAFSAAFVAVFIDPTFRSNLPTLKPIAWSFPTFLANYTIPTHGAPLSLFVAWSLCFEEQFYIVLILMYLLGSKHLVKYIAGAALASVITRTIVANFYPQYLSESILQMETHYRFDAIAWGCLAWIYHEPISQFWSGTKHRRTFETVAVALTVSICCLNPMNLALRALWYIALAPIFTILVSALCFSPGFWLARVLAWAPLVLVGSVSYEIYLSHITVFRVLSRLGAEHWPALYYPLTLACATAVGWAFHRLFSKPAQRVVRRWLDHRPA
jgi:peptidoglycan/LPS O-acetylase OafA/YrhL